MIDIWPFNRTFNCQVATKPNIPGTLHFHSTFLPRLGWLEVEDDDGNVTGRRLGWSKRVKEVLYVTAADDAHVIPVKGRSDEDFYATLGSILGARNELEVLTFIDRAVAS